MQSPDPSPTKEFDAEEGDEKCPACGTMLRGGEIPQEDRVHFGGKTHFSRKIGIYDRWADRTVSWKCPDCGHEWPRDCAKGQGKRGGRAGNCGGGDPRVDFCGFPG